MARDERHARARRRIPRRQRTAIAVTAAILVSIVVGYFAYRAQANLPGVQLPDQGNLHIASADSPHVPYNSDPPHRHLGGGWMTGSLAEGHDAHQHRAAPTRCHKPCAQPAV